MGGGMNQMGGGMSQMGTSVSANALALFVHTLFRLVLTSRCGSRAGLEVARCASKGPLLATV